MPDLTTRSSKGRTSGRARVNIRIISTVHRPTPFIRVSSSMMFSSDRFSQEVSISPFFIKKSAVFCRYADFWRERPTSLKVSKDMATNREGSGYRWGNKSRKRPWIAVADAPESCWKLMDRKSAS